MKRILQILLIILLPITFFSPAKVVGVDCSNPAVVKESFSSTYDLSISVNENGSALVTQKLVLKNLTGTCYVDKYDMVIQSPKVRDISGRDLGGNLDIDVSRDSSATRLSAKLNKQVAQKGDSVELTLNYTVDELAKKEGEIWSLVAHWIEASEKINSYVTKVMVPNSFGEVYSVTPAPDSISQSGDKRILTFGKSGLSSQGIYLKFGNQQQIGFKLQVPVENRTFFKRDFSIVLPPDTEKQQVLIRKIEPKPDKIIIDQNANYLAEYKVGAGTLLTVNVEGVVRLIGKNGFPSPKIFSDSELTDLKAGGSFVKVQDKLIQEKAKELKEPLKIYNFVTSYLSFDQQALAAGSGQRRGAAVLLRKKQPATNLDFVDLFVSLAKAAGFPAREVFGISGLASQASQPIFVGSPLNTKSLHVWAQIYDQNKKSWVDVDPTWGNTSGVSYFGQSFSDRAALFFSPAGEDLENLKGLTLAGAEIESYYLTDKIDFSPKVDLKLQADQVFAGFPVTVAATVENKSGLSLIDGKIDLSTSGVDLVNAKTKNLPIIFPYEKRTIEFKIRSGRLFKYTQGQVKAGLEAKSGNQNIKIDKEISLKIQPFFSFGPQQILLFLLIILLLAGFFASRLKRAS